MTSTTTRRARMMFAVIVVVATAAALIACQLIVGVKDESGVARPASPADVDVADAGDPCVKHHPPAPPAQADPDKGVDAGPTFFAVRTFIIRSKTAPPLGYDLDNLCTGNPTSTTNSSTCRVSADASDDDGGADNTFGRAFSDGIPSPDDDPAGALLNGNVRKGLFTLLIQVSSYNGQPNDDAVDVAVITALRMTRCDGDVGEVPLWDGCDVWSSITGTPIIGGASRVGMGGYVHDGVLVARSNPGEILGFGLGTSTIAVHDALVTTRIDHPEDGGPTTVLNSGIIAGRVLAANLLQFVNRIEFDNQDLCENPATAATFAKTFEQRTCAGRDLFEPTGLEQRDGKEPPRCNALSFTIGFSAEPAQLDPVKQVSPAPLRCPDLDASCPL